MDGYVSGLIAVARALGDVQVVSGEKLPGLGATPGMWHRNAKNKVYAHPTDTLQKNIADLYEFEISTPQDEYLIIACDGLWDFISMDGVVEVGSFVFFSCPSGFR